MAAKILKLLCVFFSVLTVLLCGCEHNKHTSAVKTDFSADFSAEYRGLKLSGSLVNTRQGYCAIELSAPKTLEGLSVTRQDNELSIARGGVKATADESYLPSSLFVCDIIYHPFETALLKMARNCGCRSEGGLAMLVGQAAESYRIWTGLTMPEDLILDTLTAHI